jgi:hypothetical protein
LPKRFTDSIGLLLVSFSNAGAADITTAEAADRLARARIGAVRATPGSLPAAG